MTTPATSRPFLLALLLGLPPGLAVAEPPAIPVGLDAYRQWERWPYLRLGARAYLRSTYDRAGGNEAADASHFLYQQADDFNVTLDVEGPGILYFVRTNHWHGSPWHYEVDGVDHLVQESSTADPTRPVAGSTFRVRVRFTPVERPLFPGHPLAERAWSEIRYDAYCIVWPGSARDPERAVQPSDGGSSRSRRR